MEFNKRLIKGVDLLSKKRSFRFLIFMANLRKDSIKWVDLLRLKCIPEYPTITFYRVRWRNRIFQKGQ